jgi:LemA protein
MALGRLLSITESYPDLKANENFSELQAQLEGTENRINEARKNFNTAVKEYNISVRRFPGNIIAGICGFERKAEFKADESASKAPEVKF